MKTEHLLYFTKVVEYSSLTLASEHLFVSQQTLSAAMKTLEKSVGVKLFKRTHNGLNVTEEGKYIYQRARKILELVEDMQTHFTTDLLQIEETLTIALTPIVKDNMLSKVITYFQKNLPKITLQFQYMSNAQIINAIENQKADIGLFNQLEIENEPYFKIPESVHFSVFSKQDYDFITSIDSHLAQYSVISMKSVKKQPLVFYDGLFSEDSAQEAIIKYFNLDTTCIMVDSRSLWKQTILDGLAYSLVPHNVIFPHTINISLQENIRYLTGYIYSNSIIQKSSTKIFINKLLQSQTSSTLLR